MTMTNNELLGIFKKTAKTNEFELSDNTIKEYLIYINYLLDFLNNKNILDINKRDIKGYMQTISPNVSKSTYNGRLSAYKTLFDVLMYDYRLEDTITINPASYIKNVKIQDGDVKGKTPLTKEEQIILLRNVKNPRDYAILTIMLNCGLRVHELIALTLDQYRDMENDSIKLTVTKGSKIREIVLNDKCINAIEKYLLVRKNCNCNKLFVSNHGTEMNKDNISKTIKVIARRSGQFSEDRISQLHNHLCRHTCLTNLYNNGVDIATIAKLAGHSNVNTTIRTYVKIDEELLKKAVFSL